MFKQEYGWFNGRRINRNVVRISGLSPGFSADIQRSIDDDACIIVLSNNYIPTAGIIATDLARIAFGESYEVPKLIKPPVLDAGILDAYVGRYQFGPDFFAPRGVYAIERKADQLLLRAPGADATLVPQSETEFFHRPYWSMIVFAKDADGRVTHFMWRYGGRDYRADRLD